MTNIEDVYTTSDYVITTALALGGWVNTNRYGRLGTAYVGLGAIHADSEGDLHAYAWQKLATLVVGQPHEREALVQETLRYGREAHKEVSATAHRWCAPGMVTTGFLSLDIIGGLGKRERLAVDGLLIPPRGGRISDPWTRGDRLGWVSETSNTAVQLSMTGTAMLLDRALTGHWTARDVALLGPGADVRAECARMGVAAQLSLAGRSWDEIDRALADGGYLPRRVPR